MILDRPIISDRLELKTLDPSAGKGPYAKWMRDDDVIRYLEVRHAKRDPAVLSDYIRRMNDSPDTLFLGIFKHDGGVHIGNVKLGPIHGIYKRADLGIILGERDEWGKGFAVEAIETLTRHAFGAMGLHRVMAGCYSGNRASWRAFEKAGYVLEGTLADHWLTEEGWQDELLFARVNKEGG